MITLEDNKEYLINAYVHEVDNTKEKKIERMNYLTKKYKDEYISKIILDTYKIIDLINNNIEQNYYNMKLSETELHYITLNLVGGWHSDIIYEAEDGTLISEYLLKYYFGNMLVVETKVVEYEFDTDDPDILSYDYECYLYIQGFSNKNKKLKLETKKCNQIK